MQQKHLITTLILLTALLPGLAIDIYLPSLPIIGQYFYVSSDKIQLTVSAYLLGYALIQAFIGSVVDSYGRRKPYIMAMFIFMLSSYAIPLIGRNLYVLLLLRFMQGISIGVTLTAARAAIADLYVGAEYKKKINYFISLWTIGPVIAPVIGGYLQHVFGWQSSFNCLAIYATGLFLLYVVFVPETIKVKRRMDMRTLFFDYKNILSNREYLAGVAALGFIYSMLIVFNIVATFLFQNVFKYSVIQYGHIAMLIGVAWFLGNSTNHLLMNISVYYKTNIALMLMSLVIIIAVLLLSIYPLNSYVILIPVIIILYCGGIIFPDYYASSIALFPKLSATAGSLMSGTALLITTFIGSGIGVILNDNSSLQLMLALAGLIILAAISHGIAVKYSRVVVLHE